MKTRPVYAINILIYRDDNNNNVSVSSLSLRPAPRREYNILYTVFSEYSSHIYIVIYIRRTWEAPVYNI